MTSVVSDVYRLMTLAVACNLSHDEAYEMLQQSFIDGFETAYNRIPDGDANKQSVLDALISYTMFELPIITGIDKNIVYELRAKRDDIIDTFLHQDTATMLTRLAGRTVILDEIRTFLRHENKYQSMYGLINSSRVDAVFDMFLEWFPSCAQAYRYEDSFVKFVMHCFRMYFYKPRKIDIWAMIREVDTTRREVEQSIVAEKVLTVDRTDDLAIHDLITNIAIANWMFFKHGGKTPDVNGVQYDVYYLILCELCRAEVNRINKELGEDILEFVDPLDRGETRVGVEYNRGAAAKIRNATEIVTCILDSVRSGKLTTNNVADLRKMCFNLGLFNDEGTNVIWERINGDAEVSWYLDTDTAPTNYRNFDVALKGVISAYTLMSELEKRGMSLVDNYIADLFLDWDIIRYMDYLSSVKCIPLIRKLQSEPVDLERYSPNLYEWDLMVAAHAGSYENDHTHIAENRYYAIMHGFLVKPRLKQSSMPVSNYEIFKCVAEAMDAVPHSYTEYLSRMDAALLHPYYGKYWLNIESRDVVRNKWSNLVYNVFMYENYERAKYYLYGDGETGAVTLANLEWHVGLANYEAVQYSGMYGLYIPMERAYFFYEMETADGFDPVMVSPSDLQLLWKSSAVNGIPQAQVGSLYAPISATGMLEGISNLLPGSIGFPWEIGIRNIGTPAVTNEVDNIGVFGANRQYVAQFYAWVDENSKIEHSFIDVLKVMFAQVMFMTSGARKLMYGREKEQEYCVSLRNGLLTGEFTNESLNWVLTKMYDINRLDTPDVARTPFETREVDTTILQYIFEKKASIKVDSLYEDLYDAMQSGADPAEKFVIAYNHVYTKLVFLRHLRDAYSLIFSTQVEESSALVCELVSNFGVAEFFKKYRNSNVDYGIRTTTMQHASVKNTVVETRSKCLASFRSMVDNLEMYIGECEGEISKVTDYNIVAQDIVSSRFSELGRAFLLLPIYTGIKELDKLRQSYSVDSAGFFTHNGSYFKGRNGDRVYYVHKSGRMVTETNFGVQPADIDVNDEEGLALYTEILRSGSLVEYKKYERGKKRELVEK